ncbi:MAG: sulfotransferase family protein [Desulfobacterales bacterium]|nr:sulfotransferase family protein [Desulfobacterales bacterium]
MDDSIIVVSGLPRSGTSMVMKMLSAGGVEVVADHARKADRDNPAGYYECEKVKRLRQDAAWLEEVRGRGVKIISHLLHHLPLHLSYKILFIKREMREVLASQKKMYDRLQKRPDGVADPVLARKFRIHLRTIDAWIREKRNMDCLYLNYKEILDDAPRRAGEMAAFLNASLDLDAMASVVDPALYRNRDLPG